MATAKKLLGKLRYTDHQIVFLHYTINEVFTLDSNFSFLCQGPLTVRQVSSNDGGEGSGCGGGISSLTRLGSVLHPETLHTAHNL